MEIHLKEKRITQILLKYKRKDNLYFLFSAFWKLGKETKIYISDQFDFVQVCNIFYWALTVTIFYLLFFISYIFFIFIKDNKFFNGMVFKKIVCHSCEIIVTWEFFLQMNS